MRVLPIANYQNQNNKKQNINFGAFRFNILFRSDEEYFKTLGKLNWTLSICDEIATPFCGGYYLDLEYKIYKKLNKKGKDRLERELTSNENIKYLSSEELSSLERRIRKNPTEAKKVIYDTLSIGEDALKEKIELIRKGTDSLYALYSNIKFRLSKGLSKDKHP